MILALDLLGKFIQHTQHTLLPFDKQECVGSGKDFWCSDWWTIEVAKCLYIGKQKYLTDPLPRRCVNNANFSLVQHAEYARYKIEMADRLRELGDKCDSILVCEVGRGLDIFMACTTREWENVYCYDRSPLYEDLLIRFFKPLGINCTYKVLSSDAIKGNVSERLDFLSGKIAMICHHSRIGPACYLELMSHENIVAIIKDGQFLNKEELAGRTHW